MENTPLYKGLKWEQPAYRNPNQRDKELLTYDQSLKRLRTAGFERHGLPAEVFGLLADNLEGKVSVAEKVIADNMLTNYGEWLSLAIERKGDLLVAYFDPVGLQWNSSANKYDVHGKLSYSQRKEYDVTGKPSGQWIDLEQFSSDFVQDMYSRPFDALPEKMRKGNQRAQVWFPLDGTIWPVGRDDFGSGFSISYFGDYGASRGVVVAAQKSSTENL